MILKFRHQLQFWRGVPRENTPEGSRFFELMADAFAGYFLHHPRGMSRQTKNIKDAVQASYNLGDCGFSLNTHHGTPLQRERTTEWAISLVDEDPAGPGKAKILTADEFIAKFTEVYTSLVSPDAVSLFPTLSPTLSPTYVSVTFSTSSIGVDHDPKANEHTNAGMAMTTSFWALLFTLVSLGVM